MSAILYGLCARLFQILAGVGIGTNLGLYQIFFALLSGRFLGSRGALIPALADTGLREDAVRRSVGALAYGRWNIASLLAAWQKCVLQEGRFRPHCYEGYRPVACDLVGFFRPRLGGRVGKHYTSKADKALPAMVFAMSAAIGSVGKMRLPLLRRLLRQRPDETEAQFQRRALQENANTLDKDEVLVVDAGFALEDLLESKQTDLGPRAGVGNAQTRDRGVGDPVASCALPQGNGAFRPIGFVKRLDQNVTARRNVLPAYKGRGAHPKYGEVVRPLPRKHKGKKIQATKPTSTAKWKVGHHWVTAWIFEDLVLSDAKCGGDTRSPIKPGSPSFRIVVIFDPRYKKPLILATNLSLTAYALWRLYRDRWPVEQMPLAAKQMLGCERAFVFGEESRWRLPELAMLAGNVLSYVAACGQPIATGFWDRCARPTCGRLRRMLARMHFSDLPIWSGQLRKKDSPTAHLPKGVKAHRRQKHPDLGLEQPIAA